MLKTAIFRQGKLFIACFSACCLYFVSIALSVVAEAATYSSIQSETMKSAFAFAPFAA